MNANPTLKHLFIGFTSITMLVLLSATAQADPPKSDQLPPGLAKKDKLPPGWQKKVGKQSQEATNSAAAPAKTSPATPAVTATTPETPKPATAPKPVEPTPVPEAKAPSTPGTVSSSPAKPLTRDQQERYSRLDQALAELETEAARPGGSDRVIARLARLTEIPQAKLREQWKAHPGVTVGQFWTATAIAYAKRISVDPILSEKKAGKSWGEIADEYRVRTGDLVQGLQGAEAAAKAGAQDAERKAEQVAK
jgi:hypothetical protein